MIDLTYWLIFLGAAFAINISPGPDLIYVLSQTINSGKRFGFCSSLGVHTGALVHILLVAFGLAAVLKVSLVTFTIVKIAGAIYLVYLGIKAIISKEQELTPAVGLSKKRISGWDAYRQGILVDLLNPKAVIFFMAFLPQFARPNQGSFACQILLLGLIVIFSGLMIEGAAVLLTSKLMEVMAKKTAALQWMEKLTGSILIGLGINLALSTYRE